jgi:electron transfer flavoprotein alpha subunit
MTTDIWILALPSKGSWEDETYGLIAEARRLKEAKENGLITALVPGTVPGEECSALGAFGVDRVLVLGGQDFERYHGELWTRKLTGLAREQEPAFILMAHNALTEDLGPRLAASLETGFISRAMDLWLDSRGKAAGLRPIANGHLFEEVEVPGEGPCLVSFLPSVLTAAEKGTDQPPELVTVPGGVPLESTRVRLVAVIEADPESAALEDAEIIVSGGRGIGKGEAFDIIPALARAIGGSVAGTRPVIDWQTLPFERQIGQTGKTVAPRLMIACGLSGANEFTAGMEKSQRVIAINTDPRARIFRFADLGVVGNAHQILPRLTERIEKEKHEVKDH